MAILLLHERDQFHGVRVAAERERLGRGHYVDISGIAVAGRHGQDDGMIVRGMVGWQARDMTGNEIAAVERRGLVCHRPYDCIGRRIEPTLMQGSALVVARAADVGVAVSGFGHALAFAFAFLS